MSTVGRTDIAIDNAKSGKLERYVGAFSQTEAETDTHVHSARVVF